MEYCTVERAREIVAEKFEAAVKKLNLIQRGFIMPTVVWRAMGINRAGSCNYTTNTIELNTNYLKSKSWEDFLADTPLHELAHAISFQLYDERGHKRTWKEVCYSIGLKGNRCHNFATPEDTVIVTRRRKRYIAHCGCGEHIITSVKYNRICKGTVRYVCRTCGEYVSVDGAEAACDRK